MTGRNMIKINTVNIGPDGMEVSGTEESEFLELDTAEGIPVSVRGPVRYNLHASMVGEDLLVRGSALTEVATQCSLCLKEIVRPIGSDNICILKEKVPEEIVDITDDIREDILISIPSRFKCSDHCKGLCPHCGANLNEGSCSCKKKKPKAVRKDDHTWDALNKLKF